MRFDLDGFSHALLSSNSRLWYAVKCAAFILTLAAMTITVAIGVLWGLFNVLGSFIVPVATAALVFGVVAYSFYDSAPFNKNREGLYQLWDPEDTDD